MALSEDALNEWNKIYVEGMDRGADPSLLAEQLAAQQGVGPKDLQRYVDTLHRTVGLDHQRSYIEDISTLPDLPPQSSLQE